MRRFCAIAVLFFATTAAFAEELRIRGELAVAADLRPAVSVQVGPAVEVCRPAAEWDGTTIDCTAEVPTHATAVRVVISAEGFLDWSRNLLSAPDSGVDLGRVELREDQDFVAARSSIRLTYYQLEGRALDLLVDGRIDQAWETTLGSRPWVANTRPLAILRDLTEKYQERSSLEYLETSAGEAVSTIEVGEDMEDFFLPGTAPSFDQASEPLPPYEELFDSWNFVLAAPWVTLLSPEDPRGVVELGSLTFWKSWSCPEIRSRVTESALWDLSKAFCEGSDEEDFLLQWSVFDPCGESFSAFLAGRELVMAVAVVENVTSAPVRLTGVQVRQAAWRGLRPLDEALKAANEAPLRRETVFPVEILGPGQALVVPLGLELVDRRAAALEEEGHSLLGQAPERWVEAVASRLADLGAHPPDKVILSDVPSWSPSPVELREYAERQGRPLTSERNLTPEDWRRLEPQLAEVRVEWRRREILDRAIFTASLDALRRFAAGARDKVIRPAGRLAFGARLALVNATVAGKRISLRPAPMTAMLVRDGFWGGSCPHLFIYDPLTASWREHGTILTGIDRADEERRVEIDLGGFSGRLKIAELEPEITYLNAVHLRVGRPDGSEQILLAKDPRLHQADAEYVVLVEGESLVLDFDLEPQPAGARFILVATGYYLPAGPRVSAAAPRE